MTTKIINRLEDRLRDINNNAEAMDLVEDHLDTDRVAEYLADNQFMDREALLYCLQDEIRDEVGQLPKGKSNITDIQSLTNKSQDVDTNTATVYDISLGYLKATPMTKNEIYEMVEDLLLD